MESTRYIDLGLSPPITRRSIPGGGPQDVASILDPALASTPFAEAIAGRGVRYTYSQLEREVNNASAALHALGAGQNSHVACSSSNHPDIVVAFLAAQRLGCVWIGIPPKLAPAEKAFILNDAETEIFISDAATLNAVAAERSLSRLTHMIDMQPGDSTTGWAQLLRRHAGATRPSVQIDPWAPAAIAYTSGTTGFPKGVVHSQHNMLLLGAMRRRTIPQGWRQALIQPPAILNVFVSGVAGTWLAGGVCICLDRNDAVGVAEWIGAEGIQGASISPATVHDLVSMTEIDPRALRSLRRIVMGGGPAGPELRALAAEKLGRAIHVSYGLTEAPGQVAVGALTDERLPEGSSGKAYPHLQVAVLDEEGNVLPPGEVGEICVGPRKNGPLAGIYNPPLGYWRRAEATAKSVRHGWLRTGDLGHVDENGYVAITARMNEVILRGGANIYPAEIERVLNGLEFVRACAVVGRVDQRLGETVEAFVQLKPGLAPSSSVQDALAQACNRNLARYKVPAHWTFVEDMPRNSMNKIAKDLLVKAHRGNQIERPDRGDQRRRS